MLYVQFNIEDRPKFETFREIYDLLCDIKPREQSMGMKYWDKKMPGYAKAYLASFNQVENSQSYLVRESFESIINYLEFGFEADLGTLTQTGSTGKVEFAPYAFPYGGMDRFLAVLRAFKLIPTKAYNGFSVITFQWTDNFYYEATELPEETGQYKAEMRKKYPKS